MGERKRTVSRFAPACTGPGADRASSGPCQRGLIHTATSTRRSSRPMPAPCARVPRAAAWCIACCPRSRWAISRAVRAAGSPTRRQLCPGHPSPVHRPCAAGRPGPAGPGPGRSEGRPAAGRGRRDRAGLFRPRARPGTAGAFLLRATRAGAAPRPAGRSCTCAAPPTRCSSICAAPASPASPTPSTAACSRLKSSCGSASSWASAAP